MRNNALFASILFAGALSSTTWVKATIVAYDPFNQAATTTIAGTASTSPGVWPNSPQTYTGTGAVVAGSLSYSNLSTNGNSAQTIGNSTAFRSFGTTEGTAGSGTGTDYWLSFLMIGNNTSEGISLFASGVEKLFIGSDGNTKYGYIDDTTNSTGNHETTVAGNDGLTHLLALHFSVSGTSTSATFYLDPTGLGTGTAPSGAAQTVASATLGSALAFDQIRLGSFSGGTPTFDEFRLGTTWVDVSPTPEPTTLAFVGLGAFGLLARRRVP